MGELELPGAPQAFCPEKDPLSEGLFPSLEVFIQHLDTLYQKLDTSLQFNQISPWIESPELALVVLEAEVGTPSHVPNLDALPRVQVVPGVLRVRFNSTICESFCFSVSVGGYKKFRQNMTR